MLVPRALPVSNAHHLRGLLHSPQETRISSAVVNLFVATEMMKFAIVCTGNCKVAIFGFLHTWVEFPVNAWYDEKRTFARYNTLKPRKTGLKAVFGRRHSSTLLQYQRQ